MYRISVCLRSVLLFTTCCHLGRGAGDATPPWARETKNVKKYQSQMYEFCRKLDLRFFVKQNRNILCFSHTFDSEVCYFTK